MSQKGFTLVEGLLAAVVVLLLGFGGYRVFTQNNNEDGPVAEFTDQLGEEQKISNFQDCMDWAMPWEVVDGQVICSAPGDVEFRAACEDVVEVNCAENEGMTDDGNDATESPRDGNDGQLYPSGYSNELTRIVINFYIGSGFSDYWVEYGISADSLNKSTPKETGGLAMILPDVFGGFAASIPTNELPVTESGLYFYRIAGTYEGKTIYTGVSTFNYK